MDPISQMHFQDRFQIISLLAQPLRFSFYRSISVILVVFLVVSSRSKKSLSSKSYLFSRRFVVPTSCYPRELFHLSDIPFLYHPEFVRSCFPVYFHRRRTSQKNSSSSHSSYRSLIIPVLRSSVLFNQLVISLFFCI